MKRLIAVTVLAGVAFQSQGQSPDYATEETRVVVEKMIDAHGGYRAWKNAATISFTHDMIDPRKPHDHWLTKEIHEQGSRRCYQEWVGDDAVLVNDGHEIWTKGWKRANPPSMMAGVSYFFINMVWMTQDEAADLELREDSTVEIIEPNSSFKTVRLTFDGASEYEYFDMFIDPKTFLLRGVNYTVIHKELFEVFGLPESTKFLGPFLKVYKEYEEVKGLKLTSRYDTYQLSGKVYGIHHVTDYDLSKPFDVSILKKPKEAETSPF